MLLSPKAPLIVGIIATAALAGYLFVRHPLPESLSHAHAQVMPGTDIHSCDQCHTAEGLTAGCLACHKEIAGQLDSDKGYHAFLARDASFRCAACHPEHHGRMFPLVSVLSWPDRDPNAFDHSYCDYQLTGRHDELACAECHEGKLEQIFALPDYPEYPRSSTFLGLTQECLACHVDVHAWPSERACLDCHDQTAFDPASAFRHDDVFVLEGVHAKTECAECHPMPEDDSEKPEEKERMPGALPFHKATGETCEECHPSPHYTTWEAGCESCHLGRDDRWHEGARRMDVATHEPTGFALNGDHVAVSCQECHSQDRDYVERYPNPQTEGYQRQSNTCQGCHEDIHSGQLDHSCSTCHQTSGWKGQDLLFDHDCDTSFALDAVHKGLSCQECHIAEDLTYRAEGTDCAACHEVQARALQGQSRPLQVEPDPHFGRVACMECHDMNVPRQSFASHAQHCAECHNDQYAKLAYRWAQTLQQEQSAVEQRVDVTKDDLHADLAEARQCGFHHLHLTLLLYDRLSEAPKEATR